MEEFKDRLVQLRKSAQLTQDSLASQLGVTYQAVSKWETGSCYPDVTLLPKIAVVFGTTVDYLLGREEAPAAKTEAGEAQVASDKTAPPSPDAPPSTDDIPTTIDVDVPGDLEIRLYCKGRQVAESRVNGTVTVRVLGRVRDVACQTNLVCDEIEGDAAVQGSLDCHGDIGGDVSVGGSLRLKGDIGGDVHVENNLECYGDIGGDVSATRVTAGEIGGDVSATTVAAGEIGGDVSARTVHMREDKEEKE
jgi:transcriptional regulator with XRE-family HTH domain/cytoskeletal protein CcmA (bactofilin family)